MDAILEAPIGVVIEKLSFDPEIKAQFLRGRAGDRTPLSAIYDLMLAREAGCWETANSLGKELNLSLYFINKTYNEAMRWAHDVTPLRFAPISPHDLVLQNLHGIPPCQRPGDPEPLLRSSSSPLLPCQHQGLEKLPGANHKARQNLPICHPSFSSPKCEKHCKRDILVC